MPTVPIYEKMAAIRAFEQTLAAAVKDRKRHQEFVRDPLETRFTVMMPQYVLSERDVMHTAVNAERTRRGLPSVDVRVIDKAERLAVGHVDYAHKYALYCTEIALGENDPHP